MVSVAAMETSLKGERAKLRRPSGWSLQSDRLSQCLWTLLPPNTELYPDDCIQVEFQHIAGGLFYDFSLLLPLSFRHVRPNAQDQQFR